MKRLLSAAVLFALFGASVSAGDGISGTWSTGAGPGEHTFVFRVQGNAFIGIVCGPCDDPSTVFRIADGNQNPPWMLTKLPMKVITLRN